MHSDMNKIPIFCKIQIWYLEQSTITQITSSVQEWSIAGGRVALSLDTIQMSLKPSLERVTQKEVRSLAAERDCI